MNPLRRLRKRRSAHRRKRQGRKAARRLANLAKNPPAGMHVWVDEVAPFGEAEFERLRRQLPATPPCGHGGWVGYCPDPVNAPHRLADGSIRHRWCPDHPDHLVPARGCLVCGGPGLDCSALAWEDERHVFLSDLPVEAIEPGDTFT